MSDSTHPLYQKGYARGRAKTESELKAVEQQRTSAELWNDVFLRLLPTAMQVHGWTIGERKITSTADRIELASRWADHAVERLK